MKQPHRITLVAHLILAIVLCSCGKTQVRQLGGSKVLLNISLSERERVLKRLGFTNLMETGAGPVERDSLGTQLFIRVEPPESRGKPQNQRTQQLIVITAQGARIDPWRYPANERIADDAKVAVWQDPQRGWQVRNGEWLPKHSDVQDVSGDWIAVTASGRTPWLAKLDKPAHPLAEFSDSPGLIAIYAKGLLVNVFTRPGWRNKEGPMKYFLFDFSQNSAKPVKEMLMPSWARITLDMDPDTGFVVVNDNNSFWGRSWLFNVNSQKRQWISTSDWTLFVKKEVAQQWIALTKP